MPSCFRGISFTKIQFCRSVGIECGRFPALPPTFEPGYELELGLSLLMACSSTWYETIRLCVFSHPEIRDLLLATPYLKHAIIPPVCKCDRNIIHPYYCWGTESLAWVVHAGSPWYIYLCFFGIVVSHRSRYDIKCIYLWIILGVFWFPQNWPWSIPDKKQGAAPRSNLAKSHWNGQILSRRL